MKCFYFHGNSWQWTFAFISFLVSSYAMLIWCDLSHIYFFNYFWKKIKHLYFDCVYVCTQSPGYVWLFATPWTEAWQAALYMEFSRQEYWKGFPFPTPGDLPDPGIELESLVSPQLAAISLPLHHLVCNCMPRTVTETFNF